MNRNGKGFRLPPETAVITFAGSQWEGAEVRVNLRVPLGVLLTIYKSQVEGENIPGMLQLFGDHALIGWNLEDADGVPISTDSAGVNRLPIDLLGRLLNAWMQQIGAPGGPLAGRSTVGEPSPGALGGMAP